MSIFTPTYPWTTSGTTIPAGYQNVLVSSITAGGGGVLFLPSVTTQDVGIGNTITITDSSNFISSSAGIIIKPNTSDSGFTINGSLQYTSYATGAPIVLTYLGANSWIAVSGGGSSFIYTQTLWVDPAGNDLTAVVGDFSKPWASVSAAIQYAMDNVSDGTVHIMSGKYNETVPIIATRSTPRGTNVISEPGVAIELALGNNYWISDHYNPISGDVYPIRINWEGGFAYTPVSPGTSLPCTIKVVGGDDHLYSSRVDSYLRFKNVCIVKESAAAPGSGNNLFHLRGDSGGGSATTLYLDGCRIYTAGQFEPIISAKNVGLSGFRYSIDIKSSELIWNGEYELSTANSYNCIWLDNDGSQLNMRNSLIWGINSSANGNESPIYTDSFRNLISIDDIQFHSVIGSGGAAGLLPTIYSNSAPPLLPTPIYIGARCISEYDVNFQCSNPLLGDLSTGLFFPPPLL